MYVICTVSNSMWCSCLSYALLICLKYCCAISWRRLKYYSARACSTDTVQQQTSLYMQYTVRYTGERCVSVCTGPVWCWLWCRVVLCGVACGALNQVTIYSALLMIFRALRSNNIARLALLLSCVIYQVNLSGNTRGVEGRFTTFYKRWLQGPSVT